MNSMSRKEFLSLKQDRDYWKNLCKEISDKNTQLEEELIGLKKSMDKCTRCGITIVYDKDYVNNFE